MPVLDHCLLLWPPSQSCEHPWCVREDVACACKWANRICRGAVWWLVWLRSCRRFSRHSQEHVWSVVIVFRAWADRTRHAEESRSKLSPMVTLSAHFGCLLCALDFAYLIYFDIFGSWSSFHPSMSAGRESDLIACCSWTFSGMCVYMWTFCLEVCCGP